MPVRNVFIPEKRLTVTLLYGLVCDEDIREAEREALEEAIAEPGDDELVVFHHSALVDVGSEAITSGADLLVDFHGAKLDDVHLAFVVRKMNQELMSAYFASCLVERGISADRILITASEVDALRHVGLDPDDPDAPAFLVARTGDTSAGYRLARGPEWVVRHEPLRTSTSERDVEQLREFERLATTDPLTALANRARLDDVVAREVDRFERFGRPCSMVLLDVDDYKQINDEYGHRVGDEVLVELAEVVSHNTRKSDVVGRWGGDEILVVLPETPMGGATSVAEHLRAAVAAHSFPTVGRVTASLGVADIRVDDTPHTLFERADRAMYAAKRGGGDQIAV